MNYYDCILADDKLRKALDAIVMELNGHGYHPDVTKYIEWNCDDDLRQRYGDEKLGEMARRRFFSASPGLSAKATQLFYELNDKYFGGRFLPDYCVFVRYGEEMGEPCIQHDRSCNITIRGIWDDESIAKLLLAEMVVMATERQWEEIKRAEYIRLIEAGAPLDNDGFHWRKNWDGLDGPQRTVDAERNPSDVVWEVAVGEWEDRKVFKSGIADLSFGKGEVSLVVAC